jgi:hypothetical protein
MVPVTGDGNRDEEAMECDHFRWGERGRRRGGSTMPEADNTGKSDAVAGEAEGGGWRSKMTKEN